MASKAKHALIIGGTRGAGLAAVRLFRTEGYVVSVMARKPPKKTPNGAGARYWAADIADETAVRSALRDITRTNGKISCVVFFQRFRGEGDAWQGELEITLTGTKRLIEMLVGDFGLKNCSIVVVSTIVSQLITPRHASVGYHVAKAGLNQIVRYYAVALGERGIRVNAVMPAMFLKEESKHKFLHDEKLVRRFKETTPLGRVASADDVVELVEFLCSDRSSFITGQEIVIDGGLTLQYQESFAYQAANGQK
jgi:NAD(P)-dependent dehydrogenase (short-subunit alcohol dehydrogenase family)